MIVYHFTAEEYLEAILNEGLTKGEIPLGQHDWINGINLTTDKNPVGHGLSDGRALTEAEKAFFRAEGKQVAHDARFPNKRAIRITIKLPQSAVKRWLPWARRRLDDTLLTNLVNAGGGVRKARTWWFSTRPIPQANFLRIERRRDNGEWETI